MNEQAFAQRLIEAGWSEEEAKQEAYEQFQGDLGDCDGDLAEIENI